MAKIYRVIVSNRIASVSLRKRPHDQRLTNKVYLSAITVTNISQSFTYKMAAEINMRRYGTIITSLSPCVYLTAH